MITFPDSPARTGNRTKLLLTAILAPSFYAMEWALVGITAGLVTFLKYRGFSDIFIWLVLWGLNLLFSLGVVLFNDRCNIDIILMKTVRALTTKAAQKSHWLGWLMELVVLVRLLFWDGPCQILIYFRERLSSKPLRVSLFVGSSGVQMFIWAKLYSLGYESVGDLLKKVW